MKIEEIKSVELELEAAKKIETAVAKDLATRGTTKRSTSEIGDAIAKLVSA